MPKKFVPVADESISLLTIDANGQLTSVQKTEGFTSSLSEPVIQMASDVPQDKAGFQTWLKDWHTKHNGQP
jgi:hypothetical protein